METNKPDMKMDYSPDDPVAGFEEKDFERYKEVEKHYMAATGYADSKEAILRMRAMRVILEVSASEFFLSFSCLVPQKKGGKELMK